MWDGLVAIYEEVCVGGVGWGGAAAGEWLGWGDGRAAGAVAINEGSGGGEPAAPAVRLQGLAEAVGVSNYGPRQLRKIHKYLSQRGVPLAAAQVRLCVCVWWCGEGEGDLAAAPWQQRRWACGRLSLPHLPPPLLLLLQPLPLDPELHLPPCPPHPQVQRRHPAPPPSCRTLNSNPPSCRRTPCRRTCRCSTGS